MKITIVSKNYGRQTINTESFNPSLCSTDSTIFKIIEHMFENWFEHHTQPGAPMAKDIKGMYYGEADQPAIYSKKGAIRQAIENLIEYFEESGKPTMLINTKDISKLDVEAAFE